MQVLTRYSAAFTSKTITRFLFLLIPYVLFGFLIYPVYRFMHGCDGMAYFSIARNFASGNYADAVNAYWSPLISWLPVLPFKAGFNELVSFRIINSAIGFLCLLMLERISSDFSFNSEKSRMVFLITLSITGSFVIQQFALGSVNPDLISALLLLIYFRLSLSGKIFKNPLITGLLAAAMYYSKAYCFYFFIAHFSLISLITYFQKRDSALLKKYALSLLFLVILIMPRVLLIKEKYGIYTLSTAGVYNQTMLNKGKFDHDFTTAGLVPPPNENAVFAWEDIYLVYQMMGWEMKPNHDLKKKLTIFRHSFTELAIISLRYPVMIFAGIFLLLALIKQLREKRFELNFSAHLFLFSAILTGGYLYFFLEARYVWSVILLCLLWSIYFISQFSFKRITILIAGFSAIILLNYYPLKEVLQSINNEPWKREYMLSEQMKELIPERSRIATYSTGEFWLISWYLNLKDFGGIDFYSSPEETRNKLQQYNIEYLLIPSKVELPYLQVAETTEIAGEVKVLRLK
jgi:hypothetical protein